MGGNSVRLLPQDERLLQCLEPSELFKECYGANVSGHREHAKGLVTQSLDLYRRVRAIPPWTGYLTVDDETDLVVGCCGFKGNPTSAGEVEIAYHTFPDYQGRGFASAMSRELVRLAAGEAAVSSVIAHTLPARNASTRILEKIGFSHVGDAHDPEVGLVWEWRLPMPSSPSRSP